MNILRVYTTQTAHYAQVALDNGSVVELKARDLAKAAPTSEDWLAMAAALAKATEPPEPTVEVEAEDGAIT